MSKERVIYLDLMRIIGFLAITAYHFVLAAQSVGIVSDSFDIYVGIGRNTWSSIAVSCFFMVSGAALIYRYEEELSLKEYYKKRFLGVYPLFWLTYLLAFIHYFYRMKSIPGAPKISFLLTVIGMDGYLLDYVSNYYLIGEWFLGALIMLYILFPLYRLIMCKCKYILPVVFGGASVWLFSDNSFDMIPEKNLIVCSLYFVTGMLLEMIRKNLHRRVVVIGRRIAAVAGVGMYILVYLIEESGYYFNSYYRIFLLSVSLFVIVMEISVWIKAGRIQRMITVIGRHSFAYYLIHHLVLNDYVSHFSGTIMNTSNTLVLFLTSVGCIYLLAVGLDKIYAYLIGALSEKSPA